ncbi:MAG: Ldh family oxidoreductase [Pseudomonadota bacterium]
MAGTEVISIAEGERLIARALSAVGVAEGPALSVARALVAAEAEGQVGHGFSRLADYAAQAKSGKVNANAEPRLTKIGAAAVMVDAENGFAYPALDAAIAWGIDAASRNGCAYMGITRSHHCGALSIQVDRIAAAGLVGIMVANTPSAIAPWGSKKPLFGTNPIAFAAPRKDAGPLVIDLSLSRVARGKIMHAKKTGTEIPLGWALNADGQPTTDPEEALTGSMVPIGEAKGTALALLVEVLASALTGSNPSNQVSSYFTPDGPAPGSGQFLMALKPDDAEGFATRIAALLGDIEASDGARIPGARRADALARAKRHGITVPRIYLETAREMAKPQSKGRDHA